MTAETGQTQGPDFKLAWRRIELLSEEGLPLTEDQKRAFQIRGLTEALSLTVGSLLLDPAVEKDPDLREHLLETCNQNCADLGRLGVMEKMFEGKDPCTLKDQLEFAQYAASLLIGEVFEKLPSISTLSFTVAAIGKNRASVFISEDTPEAQEWKRVQRNLITVWSLLGTNKP